MSGTKKQGCHQFSGTNSKEGRVIPSFVFSGTVNISEGLDFLTFPDCQRLGALA